MKPYYRIEYSILPHKTWEVYNEDYSNIATKQEALESLARLRDSYKNDQSNKYRNSYRFRLVKLQTTEEVVEN